MTVPLELLMEVAVKFELFAAPLFLYENVRVPGFVTE